MQISFNQNIRHDRIGQTAERINNERNPIGHHRHEGMRNMVAGHSDDRKNFKSEAVYV